MTKADNFSPVGTSIVPRSLNASAQEFNEFVTYIHCLNNCFTNSGKPINSDFPFEPDLSQYLDCSSVYGDNCPICNKLEQSTISNRKKG